MSSDNQNNGRDARGRFVKGNKVSVGHGNPNADKVHLFRNAMLAAITPAEIRRVMRRLLKEAEAGDIPAIKELLTRCCGPPEAADLLAKLEAIEETLNQRETQW